MVRVVSQSPARVHLVASTIYPVATMAIVARGDRQVFEPFLEGSHDQAVAELEAVSPWAKDIYGEFVHLVFLIEDVSRAWCNQLVRYRVGTSFFQESLRIAERRDFKVFLKNPHPRLMAAVVKTFEAYFEALSDGVPIEEARGVLPLGTLTKIFLGCNLRSLTHIFRQRTGPIAQKGEWDVVLPQIREILEQLDPYLVRHLPGGKKECSGS